MTYELYSFENKIPNKKILQMIDILTSFYGKKDENYDSWIDMIKNTKDYFILLGYNNNKLIGFINYMYKGKDLIISEAQIVSDYQNQKVLKNLLKEVILNQTRECETVYGTINENNTKSKEVFKHIGFKHAENKLYKMNYKDLYNYLVK